MNKINGSATSKLQGALYFPNQKLEFTGGSGANVACLKFVARRVEFRGNTDIQNKCPPNSGVPELTGRMVALVE